jgi:hypothetical protein
MVVGRIITVLLLFRALQFDYCTNAINSDSHSHSPSNCPKIFGQSQVTEGLSEWVPNGHKKARPIGLQTVTKGKFFSLACGSLPVAFACFFHQWHLQWLSQRGNADMHARFAR